MNSQHDFEDYGELIKTQKPHAHIASTYNCRKHKQRTAAAHRRIDARSNHVGQASIAENYEYKYNFVLKIIENNLIK